LALTLGDGATVDGVGLRQPVDGDVAVIGNDFELAV
jgi:hypothetical protein